MTILFVCKGNVGRSQMAEAMLRRRVGGRYEIESAGTDVFAFEGEKLSDHVRAGEVLAVMNEIGIDLSSNTRKQLTLEMVARATHVVVMNNDDTVPRYLRDNEKALFWNVVDPFRLSLEATREIRDSIEKLVSGLKLD